jgi:3-hydroxyacyl-CoA dehydrogenase/enoyl-CoA hydratase/3-hydroxybutyryl-CoA epimerase
MTGSALDVIRNRDLELGPLSNAAPAQDTGPWRHWTLRNDDDGIAWLVIDKQGASANTLSEDVLTELDAALSAIERARPKGLVIRSGKPGGFIAGADIGEFRGVADAAKVEALLVRGHAVLDRLDRLPLPTVAVIHGYCLGGGLEIALACDYRIAIEDATLGFPEVLLGLHPGLGGTVRLPRLISPIHAMRMMLTGRAERDRKAKSLGLVDAVTQERHVRAAVKDAVAGTLRSSRQGLLGRLLNSDFARGLLASRMRRETAKKAPPEHYPAPYALLDLWKDHGGNRPAMQKAEISSFARLLIGGTAQNLVRVFFLREKLKKLADGQWNGKRVHVIGAGAMGGDIAAWCAWHGFIVSLADTKPERLAGARNRAVRKDRQEKP